jgi:hypothetical protein
MKIRFSVVRKVTKAWVIAAWLGISTYAFASSDIRIELPVVPELSRYTDLLELPGYFGVALETNGLSPSMSSKLEVKQLGRVLKVRNGEIRFIDKKGALYKYEASVSINLGVGSSRLAFPVVVDLEQIASGKLVVTATPPLANLFPVELIDRIRNKASMVANASAQKIMIEYLDSLARSTPGEKFNASSLIEPILIDAYNKGGGVSAFGARDVGEAVPLADQWMLLLTLLIWLIAVPAYLLFLRIQMYRKGKEELNN